MLSCNNLKTLLITMNRREAIRACFIITAGATILPSCMQEKSKSGLLLKHLKVTGEQEQMMADLTDAIIPVTDTPGAKDVGAHLFVLMMVDDCSKPEDQEKFTAGLKAFEDDVQKQYKTSFSKLTPAQRNEWLATMEGKKEEKDNPAVNFYHSTRGLTIQCFTGSQYYLTKVQVYEMVPGRFHGCVPVKTAKA